MVTARKTKYEAIPEKCESFFGSRIVQIQNLERFTNPYHGRNALRKISEAKRAYSVVLLS